YAYFTPWSWMSMGAALLPVFVGLALAMCLAWWKGSRTWQRMLAIPLALSALSIVVYTGAEVSVVRARLLWNNPWVPVNLALTAWLAAAGASLLLSFWVPVKEIEDLAREFTSHGKQAVANSHGGTMSGAGFYTTFAIATLNNLIGNLNVKGGWVMDA